MKNKLNYSHCEDVTVQTTYDVSWQELETHLNRVETEEGFLSLKIGDSKLDLRAENSLFIFTEVFFDEKDGHIGRFYINPDPEVFEQKYGDPNRNYTILIVGDFWPPINCTDDFELVKKSWYEFYHEGTIKTAPMLDDEL